MPILDTLLGSDSRQNLALKIDGRLPTDPALVRWLGGGHASAAGAVVNEHSALSLSAVFAGVNLLSRLYGSFPIDIFRKAARGRESATDLPSYRALAIQPNAEMTSSVFRRALEWNRLLTGKACAEIVWDSAGNGVGLQPIEGWRVEPKRDEAGALYYLIDGQRRMSPRDMIYVPLVSADGVTGKGFLDYAVESLGLNISAQEFAAKFFGNGARPGGLLVHPGNPPKATREEFAKTWGDKHGGAQNAHKIGVMWGGWTFDRAAGSVAPEEAQLLETRKFGTEEVARWLNIPPHFLAELSRATFSNIEEQGINFVVYSIGLTVVDYEQEYNIKLLNPPEIYCKHNLSALLRGKATERATYNATMFQVGKTVNEIRENEDLNPVDGGDEPFVPLNMVPLRQAVKPPETKPVPREVLQPTPEPPKADRPAGDDLAAKRLLLADTLSRLLRQECNAIRRAAARPREFPAWAADFHGKQQQKLQAALAPVLGVCWPGGAARAPEVAALLLARSKGDLAALIDTLTPAQFEQGVNDMLDHWEESRPAEEADAILGGTL